MSFRDRVRNRKVDWPTQRRFAIDRWSAAGAEYSQGESDDQLIRIGKWVHESLKTVRPFIENSPVWNYSIEERARYLVASLNQKHRSLFEHFDQARAQGPRPLAEIEELAFRAIEDRSFGTRKISDVLDSFLESMQLCLTATYQPISSRPNSLTETAFAFDRVIQLGIAYQTTENVFHRALWQNWVLFDEERYWHFLPDNPPDDLVWMASYYRFDDLVAQMLDLAPITWREYPVVRETFLRERGLPWKLTLSGSDTFLGVDCEQYDSLDNLDRLPIGFINRTVVGEFYHLPLLHQSIEALNGKTLLDLVDVYSGLMEIGHMVFNRLPMVDTTPAAFRQLDSFSPVVSRGAIVKTLVRSAGLDEHTVSAMLDLITWTPNKRASNFFFPLIEIETPHGKGVMLVLWPLLAGNIYRLLDYWLTEFGLSLGDRGEYFEEHIAQLLTDGLDQCPYRDLVDFANSVTLKSSDDTKEEIDLLLRVGSTLVVGEAKCQKLPISDVERFNYLSTLEEGSFQATRKAHWVGSRLAEIEQYLDLPAHTIKTVFPIVISNHSPGVGLNFNGVPVVDHILLSNYLAKPYSSSAFVQNGTLVELRNKPVYDSPELFSTSIFDYLRVPHPVAKIAAKLQPGVVQLSIAQRKPVFMHYWKSEIGIGASSNAVDTDGNLLAPDN